MCSPVPLLPVGRRVTWPAPANSRPAGSAPTLRKGFPGRQLSCAFVFICAGDGVRGCPRAWWCAHVTVLPNFADPSQPVFRNNERTSFASCKIVHHPHRYPCACKKCKVAGDSIKTFFIKVDQNLIILIILFSFSFFFTVLTLLIITIPLKYMYMNIYRYVNIWPGHIY